MASLFLRRFMWIYSLTHKSLQYMFILKELNLRKRRWLKLLKDYNMNMNYNSSMANVVVDSLRTLYMGSISHVEEVKMEFAKDMNILAHLGVRLIYSIE